MIRTYGLFWKSGQVDWGTRGPGKAGTLLGARTLSNHARQLDFRDQRGIYALYSDFELVYVGQTGAGEQRLFKRLKDHLTDHLAERWDRFSWFGVRWVKRDGTLSNDNMIAHTDTKNALNVMEAVAIAISEPRLNLQRGNWKSAKAQQYFQVVSVQEEPLE